MTIKFKCNEDPPGIWERCFNIIEVFVQLIMPFLVT